MANSSLQLNILRSEILGYCFESLIYESEVESESVKGDLSSAAAAEVRRRHRRRSAETLERRHRMRSVEAPQKAQCGDATVVGESIQLGMTLTHSKGDSSLATAESKAI